MSIFDNMNKDVEEMNKLIDTTYCEAIKHRIEAGTPFFIEWDGEKFNYYLENHKLIATSAIEEYGIY